MDYSLQSDAEVSLQDVTNSTREGGRRRDAIDINETGQDDLRRELAIPVDERDVGRTNDVIERERTHKPTKRLCRPTTKI